MTIFQSKIMREARLLGFVLKREFLGYFMTPMAYIVVVAFLLLIMGLTFYVGHFFESGVASLKRFFFFHPWLYLIFAPAISMRLWAEEKKNGTIEILFTLPVSRFSLIMGKFLASLLFMGLCLALTFPIWITVNYLGSPDNGLIISGYLASFLCSGVFLAFGSMMSSMTNNQVVAFILTVMVCFLSLFSSMPMVMNFFAPIAPDWVQAGIASMSVLSHYQSMIAGVLRLSDAIFFIAMMAMGLSITGLMLRYNQHDGASNQGEEK